MANQKRFSVLLSIPVGLLVGLNSLSAQATVCTTDADCGKDAVCVGAMTGSGGAIGVGVPTPAGGSTSVGSGVASGTVVTTGTGGVTGTGGGTTGYVLTGAGTAGAAGSGTAGVVSSGSGGTAGTPGDAITTPAPAPDPMPTVPPNVIGYCQALPKVCKTTAECPADFTCYKALIATTCRAGAGGSTGVGGSGGSAGAGATPNATGGNVATAVSGSAPIGVSSGTGGTTGSTGAGATGGTDPTLPPDGYGKCDSTPVESETGYCRPVPRTCTSASQCPAPLNCQASPCTGQTCPSTCTFTPVTCTADSDCTDPNYECATVSKSSWCTGSGGCSKDGVCTTTPPVCGTTETKQCMPKRIDCSAGQTCPSGWSCYDSSDHAMSAPSWWNVTEAIKVCMPDGIILAVDGHASGAIYFSGANWGSPIGGGKDGTVTQGGGNSSVGSGGNTGSMVPPIASGEGGAGGSRGTETAPTSPAPVNDNGSLSGPATSTATSTATGTAAVQPEAGGGCSFGGSGSGAWAMVLTGLAFALSFRRRRS